MRVYSHSKPYILLPRWLVVTYVCLGWLMKKRTSLYNFPGGECDLPTESLRCAVLNGRQGRTLNGIATVSRTGLTNGSSSVYSLIRRVQEVCLVFTFPASHKEGRPCMDWTGIKFPILGHPRKANPSPTYLHCFLTTWPACSPTRRVPAESSSAPRHRRGRRLMIATRHYLRPDLA